MVEMREITKERYKRAMRNHKQLTDEDFCEVFTERERLGTGIIFHAVTPGYGGKKGKYYVIFELGKE